MSVPDAVDGARTRHRKCHKVIVVRITGACSGCGAERGCRWENEASSVCPRTARVMTTLMRNGRDRRSENPIVGHARKERVLLPGTDQRITSWPAATAAASQPRETSERQQAEYMAAPDPFADSQIPLAPRAPSIHGPDRRFTALHKHGSFRGCCGHAAPAVRRSLEGRVATAAFPAGSSRIAFRFWKISRVGGSRFATADPETLWDGRWSQGPGWSEQRAPDAHCARLEARWCVFCEPGRCNQRVAHPCHLLPDQRR